MIIIIFIKELNKMNKNLIQIFDKILIKIDKYKKNKNILYEL